MSGLFVCFDHAGTPVPKIVPGTWQVLNKQTIPNLSHLASQHSARIVPVTHLCSRLMGHTLYLSTSMPLSTENAPPAPSLLANVLPTPQSPGLALFP